MMSTGYKTKSMGTSRARRPAAGSASSKNGIKLEKLATSKTGSKSDLAGGRKVLPKIKSNEERYDEILEGSLSDLLPKPPSEVRIFLSSTFSDYRSERNWLTRDAFAEVRDYCAENGLDFRVVDMRWGITDDATNEHVTETICQAEIANCKRVSLGPNFVAMLGDRFGYQPLPYAFVANEFDVLYKEAKEEGHPHVEVLHEWYKRDDNNVPPIYCIKPIRDVLPHFGDHSSGNEEARQRDAMAWNEKHLQIHDVLRCAATSLASKNIITEARKHDFFKSVTEIEVTDGILEGENPNQHALCYMRDYSGLTQDKLSEQNALRNIDGMKVDGKLILNKQVIAFQNKLKNGHVPTKLYTENIRRYSIPWKEGGIISDHKEHAQYLNKFCREFVIDTKRLIGEALHQVSNIIPQSEYYTDLEEALHHSHFCVAKCASFRGQEETLDSIKSYLSNPKNRKPLTVYAKSGVGKTSILAMSKKLVPQWFGTDSISIIRFLGTSSQSGTLFDVLRGVMGQLADIFDLLLEPTSYKSHNRITKKIISYLPRFLRNISRKSQKPIYIFLDSIDQLSSAEGAYEMQWLPSELPPKIHFILSVIPNHGSILNNTRKLLNEEKCFIEVKPLPEKTGKKIIDAQLSSRGRKLTPDQMKVILKCLEKEPSPLFLKLFLDKALAWRSYTETDQIRLETSVKEAITHLFEDLEAKYGKFLISRALGYITVGYNGLSELELEDVLSCDDAVLDEVYTYHDPPIEGVIRIPPLLWARIRVHINEYLAERRSQGKSTLSWYHRQFVEAALERYTEGNEGRILHRRLAELYLSEKAVKKDITLSKRKGLTIKKADREITVQPMNPSNKRMLEALPYHLLNARNAGYLKQGGICNLKFLMTRMAGFTLDQVIKDIADNIELLAVENPAKPDPELEVMLSALKSARSSLRVSTQMPVEFLARLKYDRKLHPHISNLLDKSKEYIENQKESAILPLYPCLGDTSEIIFSASHAEILSLSDESTKMVLKVWGGSDKEPEKAVVFDSVCQRVLFEQEKEKDSVLSLHITKDGKQIIQVKIYEGTNEKPNKKGEKSKMAKGRDAKGEPKSGEYIIECMSLTPEGITKRRIFALSEIKIKRVKQAVPSPDGAMEAILFNDSDLAIYEIKTTKLLVKTSNAALESPRDMFWFGKNLCMVISDSESGDTVIFCLNIKQGKEMKIEARGKHIHEGCAMYLTENLLVCQSQLQDTTSKIDIINLKTGEVTETFSLPQGNLGTMCSTKNTSSSLLMSTEGKLYMLEKGGKESLKEVGFSGNQSAGSFTCQVCNDEGTVLLLGQQTGMLSTFIKNEEGFIFSGETKLHESPIRQISLNEDEEILVSIAESGEVVIWNWRLIRLQCQTNQKHSVKNTGSSSQNKLSDYKSASRILFHQEKEKLITVSPVNGIKVWDVETFEKVKDVGPKIDPKAAILACNGNIVLVLDKNMKVSGWEVDTGLELDALKYLHGHILALTKDPNSENVYLLADIENKFCVTVIDMIERKITQTIAMKEKFENTDIELNVTENGNYLLMKVLTTPKQYEIITLSEKRNNLYSCNGRCAFYAVDLKKKSGVLLTCYRQLSTIPCLGDSWAVQRGNCVIIGRERLTVVWDVATNKCDQRIMKGIKIPQFYRPWWGIEDDLDDRICYGNLRCMEKSESGGVVAMGSDDGWFMMYDTDTGGRLGKNVLKKIPQHQGPVTNIALSPSGLWAVSYGRDATLRFWNSTDANQEVANIKLGMDIHQMAFSHDNVTLAVLGTKGTGRSFVHLFKVLEKPK